MDLLNEQLTQIPGLHETEQIQSKDKIIYLHLFLGGCDWYVAEYDPKTRFFYGFAVMNGDYDNGEWGYTSLDELTSIKFRGFIEVEWNPYFKPTKASEIGHIKEFI